jgi:PAS domain S-box-containing protein
MKVLPIGVSYKAQTAMKAEDSNTNNYSESVNEAGTQAVFLGTASANRKDIRRAFIVNILLITAAAITAPYASVQLNAQPAFAPIYDTVVIVLDLVTALLLFAQYRQLKQRSLLVLACGYIFTPLLMAAHALSFPDAFVEGNLIGGSQSTAWLWVGWHTGFPVYIMAYAMLRKKEISGVLPADKNANTAAAIVVTILLALAIVLLTTLGHDLLPQIMFGNRYKSPATRLVLIVGWLAHLAALILLIAHTQLRRLIDVWISVMLIALVIDLALSAILITGRYQAGFYLGRLYGLLAACFVLMVLLRETVSLYAGAIRSAAIIREQETKYLIELENEVKRQTQELLAIKEEVQRKNDMHAYAEEIGHIGSWIWNINTNKAIYSDNMFMLFGLKPGEVEPDFNTIPSFVHPDDRPRLLKAAEQLKEGNHPIALDYKVTRKDGMERIFSNRIKMTRTTNDEQVVIGITEDITERKKAHEELLLLKDELAQKATDRYTTLFNSIDEGFCIVQVLFDEKQQPCDFRYIDVNPAFEKQTGVRDAVGKTIRQVFPQVDSFLIEQFGKVSQSREHVRFSYYAAAMGKWFELYAAPIGRPEDNHVTMLFNDVTEQRKYQEALRISEERYRAALQSADMAAWDWDIVNDKVVWNDQHYIMLGLELDAEINHANDFLKFVHNDDLPGVKACLEEAMHSGLFHEEFRVVRTDGEVCWMSGYGRAVSQADNKVTRMVGVMYDITERKLAEKQREDFIGIASHELKTPVTSIKNYAEILQEKFEESGNVEDAMLMQKMNVQIDRMSKLIKDLLDTTRISESNLSLHPESFDINELIQERVEELQRISDKHQLVLYKVQLPEIKADRVRIGQVVTNLISNAIKYAPQGGQVIIKTEATDNAVKVSVADNGIGIPKHLQEKIFERFYRVSSTKLQTYPGMGLGLYITAGIIHRHGGSLGVQSKEGQGSTFSFVLPYNIATR